MAGPHSRPTPPAGPSADDPTLTLQTALPSTIADDGRSTTPGEPPVIPRYTVGRRLGYGGMGVVYEAVGPVGVAVALKVIHPDLITPNLIDRFRQEARAMMALDHPHLARIFDYGEADAGPYFTMRLLSGRTLSDLRPAWARDPAAGLRTLLKAVGAVAHLHARRLVHRDLKPSNILLDDADEPFVSDLGLVKEFAAADPDTDPGTSPAPSTAGRGGSPTLTRTGRAVGTRAYMAPEQAVGDHNRIGPPADVHALGLIAGEIAWGFRPTIGVDGNLIVPGDAAASSLPAGAKELLRTILPPSDPPPPTEPPAVPRATLPAAVEAGVRHVIAKALAFDPADRYPSAAEFGAALAAALEPPKPVVPDRPTRRRALVAGGVAVAGLGAWALWAMLPPRSRKEPVGPLEALQTEFASADEIDLFRDDGTWRWSEFLVGPGEWHVGAPPTGPADARGWFAVPKDEVRLLEVARGLTAHGFRLVIEVSNPGPTGESGVYVGRSIQPTTYGRVHALLAMGLREHDFPRSRKANWEFGGRIVLADQLGRFIAAPAINRAAPVLPDPGAWRRLDITLAADRLTVVVADGKFVSRTRNELLAVGRGLGTVHPEVAALTPIFDPGEGLGLFGSSGPVAVRSARLIRLPPANP
jgi:serine/threonine protein kinase